MHDGSATLVGRPSSEHALAHLDSLPTLAPIAVKLIGLTGSSGGGATDVAALVRADPALATKILSAANAAALGRRNVTTVEQAVVTLGFSRVRSLVLALQVFECLDRFEPATNKPGFPRVEFWKHALAVACAARRIALCLATDASRGATLIDPEEAFVAGLLHDIGKIALAAVFPKAYDRIASQCEQSHADIADVERALLGIDHTIAGRRIAERWRLPDLYRDAIWLHHLSPPALPSRVASPELIAVVQLADTVSREQHIGFSGNTLFFESAAHAAARMGVPDAQLARVIAQLAGDVAEHADMLGLERTTLDGVLLASLQRANAELARANDELVAQNRRLAADQRYFRAIAEFDASLPPRAELAAVVVAIATAARTALQWPAAVGFALHDSSPEVELATACDADSRCNRTVLATPSPELTEWLRSGASCAGGVVVRAPLAIRTLLADRASSLGPGDPWLVPIRRDGRFVGGVAYASTVDESTERGNEAQELNALAGSFALAIVRANVQAATARLADDLAVINRRMQHMQGELLRTRSLSMIAEMAAGAGHELNNPLSVISGRAQMLLSDMELDPDGRRSLETIAAKAHECSRIVSEFMDFARPPAPQLGAVDLARLVAEVAEAWLAESGLPASRLVVETAGDPAPALRFVVRADREHLRSVVAELLRNATEAITENHGSIRISWRSATLPPGRGTTTGPASEATGCATNAIELCVRDTGCGMTPAVLQRVFDPFFSHRKAGRGRGLGLARAHRIIEAHAGRVSIESRPQDGTSVFIVLPAE